MTSKPTRKPRVSFTPEQKLDYAKLMVEDNYTVQQIVDISGAGSTAVSRWKKQYLSELKGETPKDKKALTAEQQKIQSLEQQLWRAKRDNEILKKAAAFFVRENKDLN
jgi:transposase